ncbi:hypothetical protein PAXRUDRAFT_827257 [Paxillus rubicundulus Ve08.2h10]|uniref:Uncharacterized protein n=1 Tax=Paxillus rubicundulus Ve08.2h10 TaxID=930991 RepID=A0A0D0DYA8_9AGAM|nr:hypothetical protein PAXRUDRAFT_827257 [Paxillus rubicundulus Ve08.2h10]
MSSVEIQKFAIDIAYRLSSLRNFLEASEDLLEFNNSFTDIDIQRHGRKLLAIMEVARTTLDRVGVKLHLFTSCSPKYQPYKSAYFKMLVSMIRQHKEYFHPELRGRVDRLLLPLTTRLVIRRNYDPYVQLGIADLMKNLDNQSPLQKKPSVKFPTSATGWRVPPWPSNNIAATMPPPDVFPPRAADDTGKKKRPFLDSAARRRPVHRQHSPRPEPPQSGGDAAPSMTRPFTHTRRHFGIFCTGKSPQHPRR